MTKGIDLTSERAVVVGAGGVSNRWFPPFAEERVEVAGVVDLSLETASSQIAEYGLSRAEAFTELKEALRKCKPDFVGDLTVPASHPTVVTLKGNRNEDHAVTGVEVAFA